MPTPSVSLTPRALNPWYDGPRRYGYVSRILHWGMAVLLLWQFAGMLAKVTLGRDAPLTGLLSGAHAHVGLLLLVLAVVRAVWALSQRTHRPGNASGFWGMAAWLGHTAMYLLMLIVPALAALRMLGNNRAFSWFGVIPLNDGTGDKVEWMVAPASAFHGLLGWVLGALIVGHVLMVLVHHFVWKDEVAARMLGRVR